MFLAAFLVKLKVTTRKEEIHMLTIITFIVQSILVPILAPIVRDLAVPYLSRWAKKKDHNLSPRLLKQRKKR